MLENLHFVRPLWLLALIPLALLAWRAYRPAGGENPWRRIVDPHLLPLLMATRSGTKTHAAAWLVAIGWTIAVLALADPAWERKPLPVYQTTAARVIVLDLSRSMEATDLKPSRLARARYKIEDVLASNSEGRTALVVYAGDAFTVSPLTRDAKTIRALLKVLEPNIMPIDGKRADLGLQKAGDLLRQAGAAGGQVLLITDGVDAADAAASEHAAARLRSDGHNVSVLGVVAESDAAVTVGQVDPALAATGKIAPAPSDIAALQSVARAGGGEFRMLTDSGAGLNALLTAGRPLSEQATTQTDTTKADTTAQGWKERGPLLVVLLLPLAALAFRRNWLLGVVLAAGIASPPQTAEASTWDDLWQRPDQQSAHALAAGDYAKASALATDAERRGSAEYKRGNYRGALDNFANAKGADADYNRGNALAKLGRYQDAIDAYDQSLKAHPSEDARANKAAVEALLKQQHAAQQQASPSRQDGARNDQNQAENGSQKSSPSKPQDGSSPGGKSDQSGASAGKEQGRGAKKEPEGGAGNSDSSSERGKDDAGQATASGKSEDGQPRGTGSAGATSGKNGDRQESARSSEARKNGQQNQFAEAANKLEKQKADARADDRLAAPGDSGSTDQPQRNTNAKPTSPGGSAESARPLDSEEKIAAEQWLRRIPDDPGGLLRRKFLYQYRQRAQTADVPIQ